MNMSAETMKKIMETDDLDTMKAEVEAARKKRDTDRNKNLN
jgi:hypothetical protein